MLSRVAGDGTRGRGRRADAARRHRAFLAPPAGRWILTVTAHDGWGGAGTTSAWLSVLLPHEPLTAVRAIELAQMLRLAAVGDLARASCLHALPPSSMITRLPPLPPSPQLRW